MSVLAPNTNQKEHTVPEQFERLVRPTTPAFTLFEPKQFHMVPRSTSTIHEFDNGELYIGDDVMLRVHASIDTPPEKLIQIASDALLLAEHLRERQSAVQAEKEAEKDAQTLEEEAQTLFESTDWSANWYVVSSGVRDRYLTMARKAREIHGVSK